MQYALATGLILVMLLSYYIPHQTHAQTAVRDTCSDKVCHVKITRDGFMPKALIIKIGSTVIWTNEDDDRHTVTSGSPGEIAAPLKSFMLEKGDTYEFTFEYSGLYKGSYMYFDQITKTMRGEIIVEPEEEKVEEKPQPETIKVDYTNSESGVKSVSLSNGSVKSIEIVPESNSLLIMVETEQTSGRLDITLDRGLIDARDGGKDSSFSVLVEGHEGFFDEMSSTPTDRTLQIVVPGKATRVEIVGTQVVPEFPFALLIIGSTFTTMIVAYRIRARLN